MKKIATVTIALAAMATLAACEKKEETTPAPAESADAMTSEAAAPSASDTAAMGSDAAPMASDAAAPAADAATAGKPNRTGNPIGPSAPGN